MTLLQDYWIVIAIAVAVVAALTVLIWLWWQVPKWQMQGRIFKGEKERADAEDNFRKTVGQALGGAAVLIGAGAAYLQFTQQQQTARDQLQVANDLRISTQVAKGFEQLASDKPTMRLGGIYGLEGVMNTPSDYHHPVLEALCAFVRDGTIGMIVGEHPTTDIQAALTVIGRREAGEGDRLDLSAARIAGAYLRDANLSGANLGGADLRGANLRYANLSVANLRGADLGGAEMDAANLSSANLDRANLDRADLSDAQNLTQVQLDRACGKPPKLSADSGLHWDTERPCPEKPVAEPLNPGKTP